MCLRCVNDNNVAGFLFVTLVTSIKEKTKQKPYFVIIFGF
jgi:hypothetical protein